MMKDLLAAFSAARSTNDIPGLRSVAAELNAVGTVEARAHAESALGWMDFCLGNFSKAVEHYHRSAELYQECGRRVGLASCYGNEASAHQRIGNFPLALDMARRALGMYEELNDKHGTANVLGNLGTIYDTTGDYPQALEYINRATVIFEELGVKSAIARGWVNIGCVYINLGSLDKALDMMQRAYHLYEELGEKSGMSHAIGNIGTIYHELNDHELALTYKYRSLELVEQLGEQGRAFSCKCDIMLSLAACNRFNEARELLAELDAVDIESPFGTIQRETCRAEIYEHDGEFELAEKAHLLVITIAQQYSYIHNEAQAHKGLRDFALRRNNLALYVKHNDEYTRIMEEINGKNTATKLAMQEKQREIDAREKEHAKYLAVLHSTLPKHIAERVARGELVNDHYENVSVIFFDLVGFTNHSSSLDPRQLATMLESVFSCCDDACTRSKVTRIKTIGDAYLAVSFPS